MDIQALEDDLTARIAEANDLRALDAVRVEALGKKGQISQLMKTLGGMSPEERQEKGPAYNALKDRVADAVARRQHELKEAELEARLASERLDVTLPVRPEPKGSIHPISQVMDEVVAIFADLGFGVADGPDIELDDYNFTKLNFPEGHPAREMHDTFYFEGEAGAERHLLRTHTSPVQIRHMLNHEPPVRVIAPGRTYRCDSDQTHTPMFHQVEGLCVDGQTNMGQLKWVLTEFCQAFFEVEHVEMRLRPSYFPFTEPSAEVDIQCSFEGGSVKIGEGSDWLEILGCGMVHPNVLRNVGYDPEKVQGWAFGMGIDRIAMLKYGIPDLRDMFGSDLRWLTHYGFAAQDIPTLAAGLSR